MIKTMKIRNIIEKDGINVVWNDVMLSMIEVSKPLINLEFNSKKADLKQAKSELKELETKLKLFRVRLNGEITDDVFLHAIEKNKNHKGNAESLIKFRANQ